MPESAKRDVVNTANTNTESYKRSPADTAYSKTELARRRSSIHPANTTEQEHTQSINMCDIGAGQTDPSTNKKILYIVYQKSTFMVSIDTALNLNWTTTSAYGDHNYATDFGEVVGSCNMADAMVDRIFIGKRNRLAYKKMLGEVIGRVLDDQKSDSAKKLLLIVDQRLNEHCRERVRMAYIFYAFFTVSFLGLFTGAIVWFRPHLEFLTADFNRYRIITATFLGGIGAFITTFIRFRNYTGSVVAGLPIHRLDGFLRIFYGVVAGLLITLAIKGNVLIGFANGSGSSQPWLGYFLAMVGGASEILIPNLISQTEQNLRFKTSVDEEAEEKKKVAVAENKAKAAAEEKLKAKEKKATEATDEKMASGVEDVKVEPDDNTIAGIEKTGENDTENEKPDEEYVKIEIVAKPEKDNFSPAQAKNL